MTATNLMNLVRAANDHAREWKETALTRLRENRERLRVEVAFRDAQAPAVWRFVFGLPWESGHLAPLR